MPHAFQIAPNTPALVIQSPPVPQQLFLLLHGYGSDAENLKPVATLLAEHFPNACIVNLIAPELADCGIGYQWFDLQGITEENRPARVSQALPHLIQTIAHWQSVSTIAPAATALFGFSQGGIMCLEASLHQPTIAARVIAHSARFASLSMPINSIAADISIHLIHGKLDSVIDYKHTIDAAHMLDTQRADFTADVLPKLAHEITEDSLAVMLKRLQSHIPKRLWEQALQAAADLKDAS